MAGGDNDDEGAQTAHELRQRLHDVKADSETLERLLTLSTEKVRQLTADVQAARAEVEQLRAELARARRQIRRLRGSTRADGNGEGGT